MDYMDALVLGALPLVLILVLIVIAVVISLAVGRAAERKGRNHWTFFWLSLLLFPAGTLLMGIIAASVAPYCLRCGTPGWAAEPGEPGAWCSGCQEGWDEVTPATIDSNNSGRE